MKKSTFRFPSLDTALNVLMVGGMALASVMLVGVQSVQSLVA